MDRAERVTVNEIEGNAFDDGRARRPSREKEFPNPIDELIWFRVVERKKKKKKRDERTQMERVNSAVCAHLANQYSAVSLNLDL